MMSDQCGVGNLEGNKLITQEALAYTLNETIISQRRQS